MTEPDAQLTLRTGNPAAPGDLALLEGFLNTWSGELSIEDFGTVSDTEKWLRQFGLWMGSKKLTATHREKIIQFRECLRAWILDNSSTQPLAASLSDVVFHAEIDEGMLSFKAVGDPYQFLVGSLAKAISASQNAGTWDRFKCCELPTCGWAFYDSTRSRTKRWCSMKTCGSRHKAREYYKRKR